jgi:glutamyl-Q tRNA(Asp) synthetase
MRTRFAPSPTGWLHLGHAFAARVAWEAAREAGGEFLVRLEDIDLTRCRPEFETAIFEDLRRLGLEWSGPVWRQSERIPIYQAALAQLQARGVMYPCFCTRQEIASLGAPQGPEGPLYPGTCRALSAGQCAEMLESGRAYAWRLDTATASRQMGTLRWTDLERGTFVADPELLGDGVLARKDIATSYHLAVTVDDAAQEISLVTRGEDLLPSTHIHRLLQALLNLPVPEWKHHRLMCDDTGKRLAKRDSARSLRSLWDQGWRSEELWRL